MSSVPSFLLAGLLALTPALLMAAEPSEGESLTREYRPVPGAQMSSADIRRIQEALNDSGHRTGPTDGEWGPTTLRALRNFQAAKGLPATGRLDERTLLALGLSLKDFPDRTAQREIDLDRDHLRRVQAALNKAGYDAGAVDGRWGEDSVAALKSFQRAKGIDPTGEIDDRTLLALGFSLEEFAAGEFR